MTEAKKITSTGSQFSIGILAKEERLQDLQSKLGQVTGLPFFVVDYKGEVVTSPSSSSGYCFTHKENVRYGEFCRRVNAYGAAASAIENRTCFYRCPSGLINLAIPIVVDGTYLGALIGGQVRCSQPECFEDLSAKFADEFVQKEHLTHWEKYDCIPSLSPEHIRQVGELAFLYVKQVCEKENGLREKDLKRMDSLNEKGRTSPDFILNVLSAVAGQAYVEDAKETERMVHLLIRLVNYQMNGRDAFVLLREELEHVECYLRLQKIRFEDKMDYELLCEGEIGDRRILSGVLLPFVEHAFQHGILDRKGPGTIRVVCGVNQGISTIIIEDRGPGHLEEYSPGNHRYQEDTCLSCDIFTAKQRMAKKYGSACGVETIKTEEGGTRVRLTIPQFVEGGSGHV